MPIEVPKPRIRSQGLIFWHLHVDAAGCGLAGQWVSGWGRLSVGQWVGKTGVGGSQPAAGRLTSRSDRLLFYGISCRFGIAAVKSGTPAPRVAIAGVPDLTGTNSGSRASPVLAIRYSSCNFGHPLMTKTKSPFAAAAVLLAGLVSTASAAEKTIVETAVEAGSFNTLVKAVQAAGLDETLSGEGPFTVFAPTDEAFDTLPKGTLESLLADDAKDKLTSVLTYHVVSGRCWPSRWSIWTGRRPSTGSG